MFKACFSSQPDHAPYSAVTVILGYFSINAAIAFSVASCLESPPHQENFSSTWPSPESPELPPEDAPPPDEPPHAASDNAITDTNAKDIAFLILFLMKSSPFLLFMCTLYNQNNFLSFSTFCKGLHIFLKNYAYSPYITTFILDIMNKHALDFFDGSILALLIPYVN